MSWKDDLLFNSCNVWMRTVWICLLDLWVYVPLYILLWTTSTALTLKNKHQQNNSKSIFRSVDPVILLVHWFITHTHIYMIVHILCKRYILQPSFNVHTIFIRYAGRSSHDSFSKTDRTDIIFHTSYPHLK